MKRWPHSGEAHTSAKLREDDVRAIRKAKMGARALARKYGVTPQAIRQARDGKTWRHVT